MHSSSSSEINGLGPDRAADIVTTYMHAAACTSEELLTAAVLPELKVSESQYVAVISPPI